MEKKDKIDIILKSLALAGALISFFFGLQRYRQINEDESVKAFWNQQFPIYKELCTCSAIIATSNDSLKINESIENFWRMYYGEARMVVEWQVHEKMSMYASLLKDFERGFTDREKLKFASFELATQCRKSISASWKIPLSQIEQE